MSTSNYEGLSGFILRTTEDVGAGEVTYHVLVFFRVMGDLGHSDGARDIVLTGSRA
jgi:hypothetical protein